MIYVTQGHEKGIGLEVFFKSFLCLTNSYQKQFVLVSTQEAVQDIASKMDINVIIKDRTLEIEGDVLNCIFITKQKKPATTVALEEALNIIKSKDILLTLPSSKDQFELEGKTINGHTEFFRKYYQNENIGMNFLGHDTNVLLLSDHIGLSEVELYIDKKLILAKTNQSLEALQKLRTINEVYFSGINPHCGEDGLIANSDTIINECVDELAKTHTNIKFHNMLSGDTLHFHMKNKNQLFVYAFHDQGLAPFKLKNGLTGINFSTGLPFKRVSVDHGTSFHDYGKNTANYIGMMFLLTEIESWI